MSATGFAGQQHFTQGQWKYVPHLSQPDPTLAVVIPTHDERTIQRLQEVTSFIRWEKKRKTKLWLSQLDYTRVWTKVHVWLLFCCTALHRCSLWLSQFSCLKTWRKTASHFLFQDANSNKQLMMVLPALATLWNTWAIIAIIIRRIVINLQLCDEAIKDTTQDRPSMIHGHTHSQSLFWRAPVTPVPECMLIS